VSLSPGVHLRELERLLGMSFNSVRYHVDRLTRAGEILRVEERGYSRLYPMGMTEEDRKLCAIVRTRTNRKILEVLLENDIVSSKQLCDLTRLARSTVSEHLADLEQSGIVNAHLGENGISCTLESPERIRLLLNQHQGLLREAADRFTDLWDF
jgi:predicted transcriptional regulator